MYTNVHSTHLNMKQYLAKAKGDKWHRGQIFQTWQKGVRFFLGASGLAGCNKEHKLGVFADGKLEETLNGNWLVGAPAGLEADLEGKACSSLCYALTVKHLNVREAPSNSI